MRVRPVRGGCDAGDSDGVSGDGQPALESDLKLGSTGGDVVAVNLYLTKSEYFSKTAGVYAIAARSPPVSDQAAGPIEV